MKNTRRDLLLFGAGAGAALPFTPLPWKLLDDSSIWSQNWPWIPTPRRGPVAVRRGACTLCPAGCAFEARTVSGVPVSLAGVPAHPTGNGALCAFGLGAHQLPWHPARLRKPLLAGQESTAEQAIAAIQKSLGQPGGLVAVYDSRPGRAASRLYRRFAAERSGLYIPAAQPGERGLRQLAEWTAGKEPLALDLNSARTVLSFGLPLLDGLYAPGRLLASWAGRQYRLIQVEPRESVTAALADRWLPVRAESEAALANALGTLLAGHDRRWPDPVTSEEAARATGLPAAEIGALAEDLRHGAPAVVLGDSPAVAALNILLAGGFPAHKPMPEPASEPGLKATPLDRVPEGSVGWLFVDGEPADWAPLARACRRGATVVLSTSYRTARAAGAACAFPAPAFLESVEEAPAAPLSPRASYGLAAAMLPAPAGVLAPPTLIARLAGWPEDATQAAIRETLQALRKADRGVVHVPGEEEPRPASKFESVEKLEETLLAGAWWVDAAPSAPAPLNARLPERFEIAPASVAAAWHGPAGWRAGVAPPLESKITVESGLRAVQEA